MSIGSYLMYKCKRFEFWIRGNDFLSILFIRKICCCISKPTYLWHHCNNLPSTDGQIFYPANNTFLAFISSDKPFVVKRIVSQFASSLQDVVFNRSFRIQPLILTRMYAWLYRQQTFPSLTHFNFINLQKTSSQLQLVVLIQYLQLRTLIDFTVSESCSLNIL